MASSEYWVVYEADGRPIQICKSESEATAIANRKEGRTVSHVPIKEDNDE